VRLGRRPHAGELCPGAVPSPSWRRGAKKAVVAVAAALLTAIYHMLKDGTAYHDLGHDHFDRRAKHAQTRRLVARLQHLGYAVEIKPLAA
jgi:transposase